MSDATSQVSKTGQTNKPVPPRRKANSESRSREYLDTKEIELVRTAAKANRHGHRDALIVTMLYQHGLRVTELVSMKWSQINFERATILINRAKGGEPSKQPLSGEELRALRQLRRDYPDTTFVFVTSTKEGLVPLAENGVFKMIQRAGVAAGLPFPIHPHMLRHSCGYALANKGVDTRAIQDYLGHVNIQHTVKYTRLAEGRFEGFDKLF
jgi:integrase